MAKLIVYCEYMQNPMGLDMHAPRFSWMYPPDSGGGVQKSYRILVSETEEELNNEIGTLWDSGMVYCQKSSNIYYAGKFLPSAKTLYFKVFATTDGNRSISSDIASFTLGLLDGQEWKAPWIGGPTVERGCFWYRKNFSLANKIKHAMAFVASPCYYILTVNGERADDSVLNNAWTDCEKTVLYASYVITGHLLEGSNTVGIECGNGWHNLRESEDGVGWGENMFSAQIMICYEDGTEEWIYSDLDGWYYTTEGPLLENSIYNGEVYDARCEMPGWDTAGYVMDETWKEVVEHEPVAGVLRPQYMEPIRVVGTLPLQNIYEAGDGSYTLDFGQNFAGWVKLRITGPAGTRITMKFAELMHEDYTVNPISLRRAKATDVYILKGDGTEVYEPRFTYHGFRYVQVFGLTEKPAADMFTACVVRSDVKQIGRFHCDNALLNQLYSNIIWTEGSNLHGLPTDCPQRDERLGWLNDMTVRNECALYNYRLPKLYEKWLQDIRDAQGKQTGAITDTAPFIRYGLRPADPVSASFLLIPWNTYLHYGDKEIVKGNYEAMKQWVAYLKRNSNHYIIRYSQMGDWAAPVSGTDLDSIGAGAVSVITPTILMGTGYFYYDCCLMAKIAHMLDKPEDEAFYLEEAQQIRMAFQQKFYNSEEKYYANNSQAGNAFPMYLGLVPEEDKQAVLKRITDDIYKNGVHLTTGNLCSRYIIEVLLENGEEDLAYQLLTQTEYPSWGYMIENGATTIWERWEKVDEPGPLDRMASHNHPMNGAVGVCFHKHLAGIRPDELQAGFKHIIFRPVIPEGLEMLEASVENLYGSVRSSWKKEGKIFSVEITVPANCTADVYLPTKHITAEMLRVEEVKTQALLVNHGKQQNGQETFGGLEIENGKHVKIGVNAGSYHFRIGSRWL